MTAFREESGVDARIGHAPTRARDALQSHFKTITASQDPFPHLQFSGRQIHNFLTDQHWLANDCDVLPAAKVIDSYVPKGGDAYVLKLARFQ
jgi:hypothetical protein